MRLRGPGKNNRTRGVASTVQLQFLTEWLSEWTVNRTGCYLDRICARELFWAACDEAGIPRVTDKLFASMVLRRYPDACEYIRLEPDGAARKLFSGLSFI
jgi:hypothetical protein